MSSGQLKEAEKSTQELLIVKVDDDEYCIDINMTLGINRVTSITNVPKSLDFVRGIINLRGQVMTVLDLGVRLGGDSVQVSPKNRIIIIRNENEDIGLLVDSIVDVIPVESENLGPPPANLGGIVGKFFSRVYTDDARVIGVLEIAEIINPNSESQKEKVK